MGLYFRCVEAFSQFGPKVKNPAIAASFLRTVATKYNNRIVQNLLGQIYDYGFGLPKNEQAAFDWYPKSANNGWSFAQAVVGTKYDNRQDKEMAIQWYENVISRATELQSSMCTKMFGLFGNDKFIVNFNLLHPDLRTATYTSCRKGLVALPEPIT
jgi:TPR repeat protein